MNFKGFALLGLCVILTALPACDNVEWGGMEMEVRVPDPPPSSVVDAGEDDDDGEVSLEPLELGALLYLARSTGGGEAELVPVARWEGGAYGALPSTEDTPDLVQRFPLERWEAGTEFLLLDRGTRVGSLVTRGPTVLNGDWCLARPATSGSMELRPGATDSDHFLAVRRSDVESGAVGLAARMHGPTIPGTRGSARADAESLGRFVIPRAEIPWPPSIPGILEDWSLGAVAAGEPALGATFVFGGDLETGSLLATGYSFFALAVQDEEGDWTPSWLWYQPAGADKAAPRLLASGTLRGPTRVERAIQEAASADAPVEEGTPESPETAPGEDAPDEGLQERPPPSTELLLEVSGAEARWLAVLGDAGEGLHLLYQDPCAVDPASGAARRWP